jgi:hypothetical protein
MSNENSAQEKVAECLKQAGDLISEALTLLSEKAVKPSVAAPKVKKPDKRKTGDPDFSTPIRPFVKQNANGMNGARKFTLLVAYLSQGDLTKSVALSDIESHWNKMTDKNLLGVKFNRLYTSQAKNEDWVHSPGKGVYQLRPAWKAVFQ